MRVVARRGVFAFKLYISFLILIAGCGGGGGSGNGSSSGDGNGSGSGGLGKVPTIVSKPNPVSIENRRPGISDWQITRSAKNHEIEGYASATSVNRGDQIKLFVNTIAPSYSIEIYRMGWYGGAGGRLLLGPVWRKGRSQPIPAPDPVTGLLECNWTDPFVLTTSNPADTSDWVSGVYLAKLTAIPNGSQSYIIFVVRDDSRASDFLFQSSVNTYQAYNAWGGKSLYSFNSTSGIAAVKVSFNRPYSSDLGAGEFLEFEYNMLRFLEREGDDVSYSTDIDTHQKGALLLSHHAFLVVGHGEYWSWEMRQNVTNARDSGVSLGFFSANTCYWQIRIEPSTVDRTINRNIVEYREAYKDPAASNPATYYLVTTRWRDPHVTSPGRPEASLIGVTYGTPIPTDSDIVIADTNSPLFTGTGLRMGYHLTGLLGGEADRVVDSSPPDTVLLAHSPYAFQDQIQYSDMTYYIAPSGAIVFAAGTFHWSWGLDDYMHADLVSDAAQQLTRNLLAYFVGG